MSIDSGIYMKGPAVWPFKQPVVPSHLMPSKKTYTPDANGIVYVDPRDVSVLLSYSFFLAGASSGKLSNLSDVAGDIPAENDVVTFFNGLYRPKPPSSGGSGLVLIESAVFGGSPSYVMTIPANGTFFDVEINNWMFSADNTPAFEISTNGGVTWLNDDTNFDCYSVTGHWSNGGPSFDFKSTNNLGLNVGPLKIASPIGMTASFRIYPGSASFVFQMKGDLTVVEDVADIPQIFSPLYMTVYPGATIPPVPARVTNIRWRPYGNGDSPPTSGVTMTGDLYLYGQAS